MELLFFAFISIAILFSISERPKKDYGTDHTTGYPQNKPKKDKKPLPKGMKRFEIEGYEIDALNEKNAMKKLNKIKEKT